MGGRAMTLDKFQKATIGKIGEQLDKLHKAMNPKKHTERVVITLEFDVDFENSEYSEDEQLGKAWNQGNLNWDYDRVAVKKQIDDKILQHVEYNLGRKEERG